RRFHRLLFERGGSDWPGSGALGKLLRLRGIRTRRGQSLWFELWLRDCRTRSCHGDRLERLWRRGVALWERRGLGFRFGVVDLVIWRLRKILRERFAIVLLRRELSGLWS